MSRPIIKLVNATTGEEIEREMNDEELAAHQANLAEWATKRAIAEEAEAKRKALLEKLGIDEEEAKLLLS